MELEINSLLNKFGVCILVTSNLYLNFCMPLYAEDNVIQSVEMEKSNVCGTSFFKDLSDSTVFTVSLINTPVHSEGKYEGTNDIPTAIRITYPFELQPETVSTQNSPRQRTLKISRQRVPKLELILLKVDSIMKKENEPTVILASCKCENQHSEALQKYTATLSIKKTLWTLTLKNEMNFGKKSCPSYITFIGSIPLPGLYE